MSALILYDSIKAALVQAKSFDELLAINSAARRMEEAGRRSRDTSMIEAATELQVMYKRYLGKMLSESPQAPTGPKPIRSSSRTEYESPATLKELNISKNESAAAQKLYAIPEKKFGEVVAAVKAKDHRVTVAAVLRSVAPPATKVEKSNPKATAKPDPKASEQIEKLEQEVREMTDCYEDSERMLKQRDKILSADDKLAAALDEIKKLNEVIRVMESQNGGLQDQNVELNKLVLYWRKRAEKSEKLLGK